MKFTYIEPINSVLPDKMKIDESNPNNNLHEAILIRLLSGTIRFRNIELDNRLIIQKTNYFKFTFIKNTRVIPLVLTNVNGYFTSNDINMYLIRSQNKEFFKELVNELSCAFYFKEKKSYTSAFIHIYRFLEHMSITFPLYYSSMAKDYYNSFGELQSLFNNNGSSGALNFNKTFFQTLFDVSDPTIPYNNDISIDFSYLPNTEFDNIKKAFTKVIDSEKKLKLADFDFTNKIITFNFSYMHDLIITFRNRFFHYMPTHKHNISSTYFVSEIFFKEFNEYAINWIGYLFNEITEKRISRLI